MSRQQLLDIATREIGFPIGKHILEYAIAAGYVTDPVRMPGSHRRFSTDHEKQFLSYLRGKIERSNLSNAQAGSEL